MYLADGCWEHTVYNIYVVSAPSHNMLRKVAPCSEMSAGEYLRESMRLSIDGFSVFTNARKGGRECI